ncbi:hypothetical protein PMIN06_001916 [Paraphaeosphaeria minitans]|uniref:Type 1 phosphatases regulator n=1 Tax=Paraphaeosphaeria minitans TaxID=565426 RepID=A0A9P6KU70_9PLEO|nr:protein phosphatase inhibitor [Paraphaeosphaeria minitans]
MSHTGNMGAQTAQPNRTSGSVTTTQPVLRLQATSGTLRLRAEPVEQRRIQWAEDVVDNEGMGKKSSKVCCIYHKPREVGESSDESSSDSSSDSDSDSEPDNGEARPAGGRKSGSGRRGRKPHNHDHDHENGEHSHDEPHGGPSGQPQKRRRRRRPSPNAYEKMPKQKQ